MRQDLIKDRAETRDSFDINWGQVMAKMLHNKVLIFPITNDRESSAEILSIIKPQLIILSGGSDTEKRITTEMEIIKYSISNSLPILGVCHGMQVLNSILG